MMKYTGHAMHIPIVIILVKTELSSLRCMNTPATRKNLTTIRNERVVTSSHSGALWTDSK